MISITIDQKYKGDKRMNTIHRPFDIKTYKQFEKLADIGGKIILVVDDMDHCNAILAAYIKNRSMRAMFVRSGIHKIESLESGYGCYNISTSNAPALISCKASIDGFNFYVFDSYKTFNNGRNKRILDDAKLNEHDPVIFIVNTKTEDVPIGNRIATVKIPKIEYDVKEWTTEEDEFLKEYYPIIGTGVASYIDGAREIDCYIRYMCIYSHKTEAGHTPIEVPVEIKDDASNNTPTTSGSNVWGDIEDAIIRENYLNKDIDIVNILPGRTFAECYLRAIELGVINKPSSMWTDDEDRVLRENYPTMKGEVRKFLPTRTAIACTRRFNLIDGK